MKNPGWLAIGAGALCLVAAVLLVLTNSEPPQGRDGAAAGGTALVRVPTPAPTPPPPAPKPKPVVVPAPPAPTPTPVVDDPKKGTTDPKPVKAVEKPAPAPKPVHVAPPASEPVVPGTTYTVRSGDSLPSIAKRAYGDSKRWYDVYIANYEMLKDPNVLRPGWVLRIPK
jgi:nucleoid-associated protein YgaU